MSYKIAIASGKGGTGKTTVSVNLFQYIKKHTGKSVKLIDCDVEEPNSSLFFNNTELLSSHTVEQMIPFIDEDKCTFCKKCVEYCEFNAISVIPKVKYAKVTPDLCHSCGACLVACQFGAITEYPQSIGTIKNIKTQDDDEISEGILDVGSPMQTMLIKEVKKQTADTSDIIIYDAPPGTSCPVVETVSDADYIILVTEPTPFGLHDLRLTVELLKDIKKTFGVVINKAGLGNNDVYDFLNKENIELLTEIPFNKEYAKSYAIGRLLDNITMEEKYKTITEKILNKH